jgi:hypothetical protein
MKFARPNVKQYVKIIQSLSQYKRQNYSESCVLIKSDYMYDKYNYK